MPLLEQVLENNVEKVKLVFKNFPLRRHKYAQKAAMAALAADKQGKFWEFHDRLFIDFNKLDDQKIREIALDLGLNTAQFETQTKDQKVLVKIRHDILDGKRAGIQGVPAVFINGRRLKNWSLKEFQILIDKEFKKIKKNP